MFLNALMLSGLAAVGGPILIHLLNRRSATRVRFAAMRFLQAAIEQNQRKLRWEDLILLLLRIAVVMLLVLALARPVIRGATALLPKPRSMLVMLDVSMSMGTADGAQTRLDAAKRAAAAAIDALPSGSRVAVWRIGGGVDAALPQFTQDTQRAKQLIEASQLTGTLADHPRAILAAIDLLKQQTSPQLVLLCDDQSANWPTLATLVDRLSGEREKIDVRIAMLRSPSPGNVAITQVQLPDGLALAGRPTAINVRVNNYSAQPATSVRVVLRVASSSVDLSVSPPAAVPPQAQETIDRIEPGQSALLSFGTTFDAVGSYLVTASLSSDSLEADNNTSIVVQVRDKLAVTIVDGSGGVSSTPGALYVRSVFGLDTGGVAVKSISAAEAAGTLGQPDLLVLSEVPNLPAAKLPELQQYVQNGGVLLLMPGDGADANFYNKQLESFGLAAGTIGDVIDSTAVPQRLADRSDHPLTDVWDDNASGKLSQVQVLRQYKLTAAGKSRLVLGDKDAVLLESALGRGRVYLFAMPPTPAWTDLPVRPGVFVPLMWRMLGSGLAQSQGRFNALAGSSVVLESREMFTGETPAGGGAWTLRGPFTLDHRGGEPIELSTTSTGQHITPPLRQAGVYEVKVAPDLTRRLAIQTDARESDLTPLDSASIQSLSAAANVSALDDASLSGKLGPEQGGLELSSLLLGALLLLAITEGFLAHRFSQPR